MYSPWGRAPSSYTMRGNKAKSCYPVPASARERAWGGVRHLVNQKAFGLGGGSERVPGVLEALVGSVRKGRGGTRRGGSVSRLHTNGARETVELVASMQRGYKYE